MIQCYVLVKFINLSEAKSNLIQKYFPLCKYFRGWSFTTCEGGGGAAILLGGHFQKRECYLGGHFLRSGIKKYFPGISVKKSV